MSLKILLILAAIYGFLIGLPFLLIPEAMTAMNGQAAPANVLIIYRFFGVANIGLGVIAWLVRNAEASKTRDAVTMGFFIFFALHALTSMYTQFTEPVPANSWIFAIVQGLFAAGFLILGRANKSTDMS